MDKNKPFTFAAYRRLQMERHTDFSVCDDRKGVGKVFHENGKKKKLG